MMLLLVLLSSVPFATARTESTAHKSLKNAILARKARSSATLSIDNCAMTGGTGCSDRDTWDSPDATLDGRCAYPDWLGATNGRDDGHWCHDDDGRWGTSSSIDCDCCGGDDMCPKTCHSSVTGCIPRSNKLGMCSECDEATDCYSNDFDGDHDSDGGADDCDRDGTPSAINIFRGDPTYCPCMIGGVECQALNDNFFTSCQCHSLTPSLRLQPHLCCS